MDENVGRDKTILLILSFVIIIYQFANEFEITKINILGNEAKVDEWLVIWSVILCWMYFLWGYLVKYGLDFSINENSGIYDKYLSLFTRQIISKASKPELQKLDSDQKNEIIIDDFFDLLEHGNSYTAKLKKMKPHGDKEIISVFSIPKYKFYISKIIAYLMFLLLDEKSKDRIFPLFISFIALICLLINSLEYINPFFKK